jgi:uncharacterized membrane protein
MVGSIAFQCIQYVLIYFVSSSATGFALTLLPFPQAFYEDATTLLQDPSTPLQGRMLIVAVIYAIAFASILIFLSSRIFYRYRMTRFLILDDENTGGMKAAMESRNLMKGNKKHLFRLDLSFWWFYLLEILLTALCFGDVVLGFMGVEMTTDAFGSYILFFGLYLCGQMLLYWWKRNEVSVTYAHAYLTLCPEEKPQETAKV